MRPAMHEFTHIATHSSISCNGFDSDDLDVECNDNDTFDDGVDLDVNLECNDDNDTVDDGDDSEFKRKCRD